MVAYSRLLEKNIKLFYKTSSTHLAFMFFSPYIACMSLVFQMHIKHLHHIKQEYRHPVARFYFRIEFFFYFKAL